RASTRSATTTDAPSAAKRHEIARPLPVVSPGVWPPPTTRAIFPASRPSRTCSDASRHRAVRSGGSAATGPVLMGRLACRLGSVTVGEAGDAVVERHADAVERHGHERVLADGEDQVEQLLVAPALGQR